MKIESYNIYKANSFMDRLIGLMFKKKITYGLLFENCHAIHTFFMQINLDIILINSKNNKVLEIKRNVKPNKILIFKQKKTSIIELPYNPSLNIKINDIIE